MHSSNILKRKMKSIEKETSHLISSLFFFFLFVQRESSEGIVQSGWVALNLIN